MNNFLMSMIISLDKDSIDIAYYETLIKDFKKLGGYHLQIDGRPFNYNNIERLLQICKENDITQIGIRTSEKINIINIKKLIKYNIRSIMFSYDNEFRDSNILIAEKLNFPIEISVILSRDNIYKIDNIIKWCETRKISLLVLERSIIAKYKNKQINTLSKEQYKYIIEKSMHYNQKNEKNNIGIALSHCPNKILLHKERTFFESLGGCSAGIISCAINSNGDIVPCLPLYEVKLGNIKKDRITNVWNKSDTLNKLRNRNNLKGNCGGCCYKNLCGGCRAESYYATGSLFGEDNTCWKELT